MCKKQNRDTHETRGLLLRCAIRRQPVPRTCLAGDDPAARAPDPRQVFGAARGRGLFVVMPESEYRTRASEVRARDRYAVAASLTKVSIRLSGQGTDMSGVRQAYPARYPGPAIGVPEFGPRVLPTRTREHYPVLGYVPDTSFRVRAGGPGPPCLTRCQILS